MSNYAIFLRGINVGGHNKVPMKDLRDTLAKVGLTEIKTYLQTGNVSCAYYGSAKDLKQKTEDALTKDFGYEAYVVVLTQEELAQVIKYYPWQDTPSDTHCYVLFGTADATLEEILDKAKPTLESTEKIALGKNCIYWQVPRGITVTSATGKLLGKAKYKATTTMRNLNTLVKMF